MHFTHLRSRHINEIHAHASLYAHETGAQLIHVASKDKNNVFSVAFKTPASDDTGVAHILEHCVLCGSERFPLKDPFNELAKGALHTYLNAMTFRDKTVYPVASYDRHDFMRLMDVYIDGVFFPLIYERKALFLQEGWRAVSDRRGKVYDYNGIVYNEMRAVYSDPVERAKNMAYGMLFQGTPYAFDAAGNPDDIVKLSFERVLAYHKTWYTPSNCYLYLYGDMDIEPYLKHIEQSCLSRFKPLSGNVSDVLSIERLQGGGSFRTAQSHSNGVTAVISYLISPDADAKTEAALAVIVSYLFGMEEAPLKKRLMNDLGLSGATCVLDTDMNFPVLNIILKNAGFSSAPFSVEACKKSIDDALAEMLEKGLDRELLDACLYRRKFIMQEGDHGFRPKGLFYNISILHDWLMGKDPFRKLSPLETLDSLRNDINFFAEVIRKNLLLNKHFAAVALLPRKDRHHKKKQDFDHVDVCQALADQRVLEVFQKQPDTQRALNAMPLRRLMDINIKMDYPDVEAMTFGQTPILHCHARTNDIIYIDFIMNTDKVPQTLLPYLGLLCFSLGKLNNTSGAFGNIEAKIHRYLGGFQCAFSSIYDKKNIHKCKKMVNYQPVIRIKGKCIKKNINELLKLVNDVRACVRYSNVQTNLILMKSLFSAYHEGFNHEAQKFAVSRAASYLFQSSRHEQEVQGLTFYAWLKREIACCGFNRAYITESAITENLKTVADLVFRQENMTVALVCDEKDLQFVRGPLEKFQWDMSYDATGGAVQAYRFPSNPAPEGFVTASDGYSVAQAMDFSASPLAEAGKMKVLSAVLNNDYLLRKVRQEGGAYGAHSGFDRKGLFYMVSYRDPNAGKTLDTFKKTADFLQSFTASPRDMHSFITGALNKVMRPEHAYNRGEKALHHYFEGITPTMLQAELESMIYTQPRDINKFSELFAENKENHCFCIMGKTMCNREEYDKFSWIENFL